MEKRLVFTGKCQVGMENFDLPEPKDGEVRVKTLTSLMSTGTENIVFNRWFSSRYLASMLESQLASHLAFTCWITSIK